MSTVFCKSSEIMYACYCAEAKGQQPARSYLFISVHYKDYTEAKENVPATSFIYYSYL